MNDKQKFGLYITSKRKQLGLTQEELAEKLFVTSTTISKWERGVTYPDIGMIPILCKELNISEHEFFTACDDLSITEQKKDAKKYRIFTKTINWILISSYAIALITCFICNLVIDHQLTWFYIVLVSIILSFTITNLPFYLKKVPHKEIIVCGITTVLIYLLLLVICSYTNGDWLFKIAYPIATFELAFIWLIVLTLKFLKWNIFFKGTIISIIVAIITITTNPFLDRILIEQGNSEQIYNQITAAALISLAFILLILGIYKEIKTKA